MCDNCISHSVNISTLAVLPYYSIPRGEELKKEEEEEEACTESQDPAA